MLGLLKVTKSHSLSFVVGVWGMLVVLHCVT
jgi:hypothetical protein